MTGHADAGAAGGPATRKIDLIARLLGVADFAASKRFYVERGQSVAKSFARVYAESDAPSKHIRLGMYKRRALAKDAGISADGTGSHRRVIGSDAGPFIDPDGFAWEPTVRKPGMSVTDLVGATIASARSTGRTDAGPMSGAARLCSSGDPDPSWPGMGHGRVDRQRAIKMTGE